MADTADNEALELLDLWESGDKGLLRDRRAFWLSNAYYHDEQWVNYDERSGLVYSLLQRGADTQRTRSTHNLIKPNVGVLMGKFLGADLSFECPPSAADDASLAGAHLGEQLLECNRVDQGWEDLRRGEVFDALLGGTSCIWLDWDDKGARRDSDGGLVYDGNVVLGQCSIAEFTVQPGVRNARDAYWWMRATASPVEQIREDYELSYTPKPDAHAGAHGPLQRRLLAERGYDVNLDLCNVFVYYERPNSTHKKGRIIHIVNDKVVHKEDWWFPFDDRLNLYVFRQQPISGRWNGDTFMNSARSIQLALNGVESIIDEHAKRAGIARLMAPYGALDDNALLTDEPGEILNYYPDFGDNKPYYLSAPQIPRWLYQRGDYLKDRLDEVMHVNDILKGIAPGDRNSGSALGILGERSETSLGPMARDQAEGWATIGSMVLQILTDKVKTERRSSVDISAGDQLIPIDITWNGEMLGGQWRVVVPLDSTMPKSRAQRMASALNLIDRGLVPKNPGMLAKLLDLGASFYGQVMDADVAKATRENHQIANGVVIAPELYDDHPKHMSEHNAFRKSVAYERMDSSRRVVLDMHILAHEQVEKEQAMQQMELNAVNPGFGAMPQADAPTGSAIPTPLAEQQMSEAMATQPGASPTGLPPA